MTNTTIAGRITEAGTLKPSIFRLTMELWRKGVSHEQVHEVKAMLYKEEETMDFEDASFTYESVQDGEVNIQELLQQLLFAIGDELVFKNNLVDILRNLLPESNVQALEGKGGSAFEMNVSADQVSNAMKTIAENKSTLVNEINESLKEQMGKSIKEMATPRKSFSKPEFITWGPKIKN